MEEKGLTAEMADGIGEFVKKRGRPLELLSELQQKGSKFLENEGSFQALNDLEILFKALEKAKCIDKIVFDLSLARGLDYYTGVIYEAVFKGVTQVTAIMNSLGNVCTLLLFAIVSLTSKFCRLVRLLLVADMTTS